MSKEEVFDLYLKRVCVPSQNIRSPYAIGMVGLVGTGKSTVADALVERLGLYVTRNDERRRFMNSIGFEGAHPDKVILKYISNAFSHYLAEHRVSYIMDLDLMKPENIENSRNIAKSNGLGFYLVQITLSEKLILERLRKRMKDADKSGASLADIEEYYKRKKMHREVTTPLKFDFVFDTSKELSPQIEKFISKFNLDNR